MKSFKLAIPLLAATIMTGCGSETIIKPSEEKHLDDAQMLIIEKSENSIFNPQTQNKLVANIFNHDRITGVMLDKKGTNLRPELISAIEKRISNVKELGLSKDAEKLVVGELNTLLTYHKNWLEFEGNITDQMLWDSFSTAYPKVTPEVKRGAELKAQYEAHIKPFEEAYAQAKENKKQADTTLKSEIEKIKDEMFKYVIDNNIAITRDKLSIFTPAHTYSMVDGKCPVGDFYTDIPMQTILNKATNDCEYAMPISNTTRGVSEKHQAGLNNVVTSMNKAMREAWIARDEAGTFVKQTERKLRDEKIIANNKFDGITGYSWLNKARRLSKLSDGHFNSDTFAWRDFGERGFDTAATVASRYHSVDLTAPDYNTILNKRAVFTAYNDLLNQDLNNAIVIDDIDSDGSTELAKDQYVDAIKFLQVNDESGKKSYWILNESKGEDDVRLLRASGYLETLTQAPIKDSIDLKWGVYDVLMDSYFACGQKDSKCLTQ